MRKNKNAYICDQKCLVWAFFTKKPYSDIFALEFEKNYCHIWNQHPQILVMRKVCEKTKIPKLGSKNALFWYFWGRTLKSYSHIWNRHRWIRIIAKFCEETKMPKVGTKNALFGYFWTGIWKQYCHIWNQHPRICVIAKFCEETKMPTFGYFWPKMPYLGIFGLDCFWKNYCYIWNRHRRICQMAKFCENTKMPNFGTKNALFGDFLPRIPHLDIFGLEFQKYYGRIWNQQTQLSQKKQKYLNLGPKMSYLGNLGAEF